MGKTGKWLRNFLGSGKKEKDRKDKEKETQSLDLVQCQSVSSSSTSQTPKEKRRWSFRRSVHKDSSSRDSVSTAVDATTTNSVSIQHFAENEEGKRKHAIAVSAATAAPADAAIAAGIRLTSNPHQPIPAEEIAALKIQSAFRCHLAKKALRALKGLVKLQALVRGHLVRKQAAATLRCMQALVTVQARARAQRIMAVMAEESSPVSRRLSVHRRSLHEHHHPFRHSYDMGRDTDDNIKIVEMDIGESRGVSRGMMSNANRSDEQMFSVNRRSLPPLPKLDRGQSPTPWTEITEISPKACNPHFDGFSFGTTQISPPRFSAMSRPYSSRGSSLGGGGHTIEYAESVCNDYSSFPSYMANTESSRAKARSQSAPKQRPDSYERTPSRRRATMEKRSVPSGYRMQRSSSQVGSTCKGYQYQCPATLKLDRSAMSLKDSECGSTCSVLTNTDYCRFLVAIEAYGTPGTNSPFHVPSWMIECLNEACDFPGK